MAAVDTSADFSVQRRVWSDRDVFDQELEKIFKKCWLYLAHESEVPEAGDYVVRRMGRDQVIVTRSETGEIKVFLNTCRHRGARLCRADQGNASHYRCSYHGWTYRNSGALVGVTFQPDVYGPDLDKSRYSLYEPAHVDSELGLIFATWDPDAESLRDYLGDIRWYLEAILSKADGGYMVVGPPVRNIVKINWKTEGENLSGDGYHTMITHGSAVELGLFPTLKDVEKLAACTIRRFTGRTVDAGNGHTMRIQHLPVDVPEPHYWGYPRRLWPMFNRNLSAGQQDVISRLSVGHGSVFPNMSFIENFKSNVDGPERHARYFRITVRNPISAGLSEQLWFFLAPKVADPAWLRLSRRAYLRTNGPAGLFEQDDTENYVGISEAANGDVTRTMAVPLIGGRNHPVAPAELGWPGHVVDGDRTEHTIRAFHRRWHELVEPELGAAP